MGATDAGRAIGRAIERHPASGAADDRRGLAWSVVFHLSLASLFVAKGLLFPTPPLRYTPTLRVDLVALPDLLRQDMARLNHAPPDKSLERELKRAEADAKAIQSKPLPAPPPAAPKAEPARPDELVLHPRKSAPPPAPRKPSEKELLNALNRIKALERIQADDSTPSGRNAQSSSVPIKGNKLSKGSSLSNDARESDQASYFDSVRDKLQANWALPVWLQRQGYSAKVTLFIDSEGRLRNIVFDQPSGNQQFDDAVRQTIQQSQPFDPPPSDLAPGALNNGIPFAFPL